jgi:hypothetical protein
MKTISVFIPGLLPSKWLSPNRGERKAGRAPLAISNAKRSLRADVCIAMLADESVKAVAEPFDPVHVVLVLRWHKRVHGDNKYRPEDAGNAIYALKAAIDGLIDARIIIDDGMNHVNLLTGRVERCETKEQEGLQIIIIEDNIDNQNDLGNACTSRADSGDIYPAP